MKMRHFWRFGCGVLLSAFLAAIAGCSHRTRGPVQSLYVTVPETGEIAVYPVSATGERRPLNTIRENPPDKPVDVSIDGSGVVFVANENGNVRAYDRHNGHYLLVHTLAGSHTGIEHPVGIAVDLAGSFYVADDGAGPGKGRLEWFAGGLNGNIGPTRAISGPHTEITMPGGVATDASGRVFLIDQASNKVLVFAADANGDAAPVAVLTGLHSPERVFVDSVLNVYVTNKADNSIGVFTSSGPESWTFSNRIVSTAMHAPDGISSDAKGRLAVGQIGGILFFPSGANGNIEPSAELRGPAAMNPAGICIH